MKDYSLNKEEQEKFILNYEKNDNKIVINYADGSNYSVPFTSDNERKILNRMKEQIGKVAPFKEKVENEISKFKIISAVVPVGAFITSGFILNFLSINFFPILMEGYILQAILSFVASLISTIPCSVIYNRKMRLLEDIEKNQLYVEREGDVKRGLVNPNVLENVPELRKNGLEEVNINIIDDLKKEELEEVLKYLEIEDEFSFDLFDTEIEDEKPKFKIRRRTR